MKPIFFALSLALVLLMTGCGKPPAAVTEGQDLRKKAYNAANDGKNKIIETILEVYKTAEYARIDGEINAALEKNKSEVRGKAALFGNVVPVEQAIEGMEKILTTREAERVRLRGLVDSKIAECRKIVVEADKNFLIANKLADALDGYENAGVDVSAAGKAVEEILALMKK